MADFELWTGYAVCVASDSVPTDSPEDAFAEACRQFDLDTDYTSDHAQVFTGVGVAGITVEDRRREDFARSCKRVPSQRPWLDQANLLLCGTEESPRNASLRELFAGHALPVRAGQERVLATFPWPLDQIGSGPHWAASRQMAVRSYMRRVDDGSARVIEAYALPALDRLWSFEIPDGWDVGVFGGLDDAIAHDRQSDERWLLTLDGAEPLPIGPGIGEVTLAEDDEGWWAWNHAGVARFALDGSAHADTPVDGVVPYWSTSDPDGTWTTLDGADGPYAYQHATGAIRIPPPAVDHPIVRFGVTESASHVRMSDAPGEWTIERGVCADGQHIPGIPRLMRTVIDGPAEQITILGD